MLINTNILDCWKCAVEYYSFKKLGIYTLRRIVANKPPPAGNNVDWDEKIKETNICAPVPYLPLYESP